MRLRSTIPAAAAAALLAAILATPGQALADTGTGPAPTDSASPSASTSAAPSATPTPTPTPTTITQPTANLPWAEGAFLGNGSGSQLVLHFQAWEYAGAATATATPTAARFYPIGAPAGTAPALTVTDFTSYGSTWSSASNIVLPSFGSYRVEIDLQDNNGNQVTVPNAGTAAYKMAVNFSAFNATAPAPLDYDHRAYTVRGTLTATDPGTGQTTPLAGATVQLVNGIGANGYAAPVGTATTDANGAFTADLSATGNVEPEATYSPAAGSDSKTYNTAQVTGQTLYATTEQTRIRFTSSPDVNVPVGGTAVITGVVERLAGSTWKPAAGAPYSWDDPWANGANEPSGSGTTDDQGDFTLRISQAGDFMLTTGITGFLYYTTSPDIQVHIPQPTSFTGLSITEDQFGEAAIDGHLTLGNGGYLGGSTKVYVQYSPDGRTWRWVGYTLIGRQGLAQDEFKCFALLGANANGYWRVYFAGTADWRPVLSKAVRIWRYPTAVTGGKPSTTRAYKGQTLRFSGTVSQHTSSWHGLAHAKVMLLFRPHGSSTWYWVTIGWTDARGRYSLRGRAYAGGTWAVLYVPTDSAHIDSVGPQTYVHVR